MSAGGSPARQLLLLLEDEASLASLPIAEVTEELSVLGVDPAMSISRARKWAGQSASPRRARAPVLPVEEPEDITPIAPVTPVAAPTPPAARPEPVVPVNEASDTGRLGYATTAPGPDLMADVGIRANVTADRAKKKGGASAAVVVVLVALTIGVGVGVTRIWPEVANLEQLAEIADRLVPPPATPETAEVPAEPAPEVSVSRLEPVPPPAPPPTPVVTRPATPEPAPAPPPQPAPAPVVVEPAPVPAPQPSAAADPNAPLNIVPRVEAPPVREARLPADVARPFTAPPSIVAIVPVERELMIAAGTGMLSSGSRRTAEETRLAARVEAAQRIAAGRAIAALVTLRTPDEAYDAVILKRPRVEENRTIADADQTLIPIMGDTAHLFDLVRLAPN